MLKNLISYYNSLWTFWSFLISIFILIIKFLNISFSNIVFALNSLFVKNGVLFVIV